MKTIKSFLAADFGAATLKLAEFDFNNSGRLRLKQYSMKALGAEGAEETTREAAILKALQAILAEKGMVSKSLSVCAPRFHVFSKFVKLPPVQAGKVPQIIRYEAQQNVPFPLPQVVWDYQILGTGAGSELEVLLVAIRAEIVEGLLHVSESAGLHLLLADVSPAALCNAFRYNYGELEDCTMLLDIGAKTSNLLFFEKGKVFYRGINLGGNSINQDFGSESKLKFEAAEKIKIEEGFVSLGGAYEEPENPHQAAISKIARQFMTRLHIQVNQTMQFYRAQQGGSAPQRLFLSGGASVMAYAAQFFAEKLNVPVEYFNPLRNVDHDPSINVEELGRVAHAMGEVVGLGLRNLAHCPLELNLMPESAIKRQGFNQKMPYLVAAAFGLALALFAVGFVFQKLANIKMREYAAILPDLQSQEENSKLFKACFGNLTKAQAEVKCVAKWVDSRFHWADVLAELRAALIRAEDTVSGKLRTPAGVWIEQLTSATNVAPAIAMEQVLPGVIPTSFRDQVFTDPRYQRRFKPPPPEGASGLRTNEPGSLAITFRAVSLVAVSGQPDADKALAFQVLEEILKSSFFDPDPNQTKFAGYINTVEPPGTFTFALLVRLKHPLDL